MSENYTTIDEYILLQPEEHRKSLQELRGVILSSAPQETRETISYKMPTFQYNGNLIHFALCKNHIGVYPGPGALEFLKEKIRYYKISKGAIQFPLNKPVPKSLVREMVRYNAALMKNRYNYQWNKYNKYWKALDAVMNDIVSRFPELHKARKWGSDVYTYKGTNVIAWGGFKGFFSLWFYNGVFLEDQENVLIAASGSKTKSLRQWRFKAVREMDEGMIAAYIEESIQSVKDGKFPTREKGKERSTDPFLKQAFEESRILKDAFEKLKPGQKNEFLDYINEARQNKTKLARIEKIKPLIISGKGLNDQYKKKVNS